MKRSDRRSSFMQAAQKKAAKHANRRCIEGGEFEELSFGRPDPIGNDGVAMRIEVGPIRTSASPNPAVVGRPVVLTATVTGNTGTATGTVEFFDGANSLGAATLTSGKASR